MKRKGDRGIFEADKAASVLKNHHKTGGRKKEESGKPRADILRQSNPQL